MWHNVLLMCDVNVVIIVLAFPVWLLFMFSSVSPVHLSSLVLTCPPDCSE